MKFSKTPIGRAQRLLGHVMAGYCVYRLLTAAFSVLFGPSSTSTVRSTTSLSWLSSVWEKEISLTWMGALMFSSTRSFFHSIGRTVQYFSSAGLLPLTPNPEASELTAALLLGLFTLSSVLMLKASLPVLSEQVLVGFEFEFVERSFNFIFLVSALVTLVKQVL